jgi:Ca2+-binding RTX toxin-like protein
MPPINDNFVDRIALTGRSFLINGSNIGATVEPNEPSTTSESVTPLASVWWSWTAPTSGEVLATIDLNNLFTVYTGNSLTNLTEVSFSGEADSFWHQSRTTFSVIAGTTYQIAVDSQQVPDSDFRLSFSLIQNGTPRNDTLNGTAADDVINGGDGNDTINGNGGLDVLSGQAGNDTIRGGAQLDVISGGAGDDKLYNRGGSDRILGGDGDDLIVGSSDSESFEGGLFGENGDDVIYGKGGDDEISGGSGNDILYGAAQNDSISGDAGNDLIYGRGGYDNLNGGDGNDTIYGGAKDDFITGGDGDDILYAKGSDGVKGGDFLSAGTGVDVINLGSGKSTIFLNNGEGFATVNGFRLGQTFFDAFLVNEPLSFSNSAAGAVITSASGDRLAVVSNVSASVLQNNPSIFV